MVAKELAPIDTSSLKESIRMDMIETEGSIISTRIIAGGEDYSKTFMVSTGKVGNLVDYAIEQEMKHGFLSQSIPIIIDSLTH